MRKKPMTEAQKAKWAAYMREYSRKRKQRMAPEEIAAERKRKRESERKRLAAASGEKKAERRAMRAQWQKAYIQALPPEEKAVFLAKRREAERVPQQIAYRERGGKEKAKIYYWRNPDRARATQAIYREKTKRLVMEAYGGACVCCGENELAFLSIDHIKGDGAQHRKSGLKASGMSFYQWLKKNDFPQGFQVLCMNCNVAKRTGSECPHKSLVRRILNLVTSK